VVPWWVLQARGIEIPTLCHDDRLGPVGNCRSCLVEVNGGAHLQPACMTMPTAGMVVETRAEAIVAYRRSVVELLARRYPASAIAEAPGKEFHRWLDAFGLSPGGAEAADAGLQDRSHPYIAVDMSRCIDCERCVRICREVQGQDVWHVRNRGDTTRIVPDGPTLLESSRVSCGACVDTCPTSALTDRRLSASEPPTAWTRTTCPYCGTGCEMRVGTRDGAIVSIRPEPDAPVSKGHLCVKGRYAFDFVTASDRITEPMIREADGWRRVSWDEAIAFVAARLQAIVARHGPDSVGVLGSARATNEDNYVAQKFARVAIGTNNVDCCARVCHAPSAAGLKLMLGSGMATNAFDDIERARTIVVWGANATEDHPILGARIRQAARRAPASSSWIRGASSWPRRPTSIWTSGPARTCRCSTRWPTSSSRRAWRTPRFSRPGSTGWRPSRSRSRRGRRPAPRRSAASRPRRSRPLPGCMRRGRRQ
jgi:formate dehydrogenase major subunit